MSKKTYQKKLSFVIPCWGSAHTLRYVVEEIIETVDQHDYANHYEIILVDDSSTDNTLEVIQDLCDRYECVKGVTLSRNFGQHGAVMAGFASSTGDLVINLDDDGEIPASDVWLLIEKLEEGYDVVFAEYTEDKRGLFRRIATSIKETSNRIILEKPRSLVFNSFFVCRRFVVEEMLHYKGPYPYLGGLIYRTTHKIANVKLQRRDRIHGKSTYTVRKLAQIMLNEFTSFSVKPLRIAAAIGGISAAVGFIFAIVVVIQKMIDSAIISGWSSTISLMLIIGGIQMMIMGLIGEYIGRIFISINRAPQYIIRETYNMESDNTNDRE